MLQEKVLATSSFEDRLRRSGGRSSRNAVASAKVTREEQAELENAAKAENKALSEWAREVLLREARRSQDDPVFTEVVAVRMLLNYVLTHFAQAGSFTLAQFTEICETVRQQKRPEARKLMTQYTAEAPKE